MSFASSSGLVGTKSFSREEESNSENQVDTFETGSCSTQPGKLSKSALRRKRGSGCASKKVSTEAQTELDPLQRKNKMLKEKIARMKSKRDEDKLRNLIVLGKLKQERRSRGVASSDEEDLDFDGCASVSSEALSSGSGSPEASEAETFTESEAECADDASSEEVDAEVKSHDQFDGVCVGMPYHQGHVHEIYPHIDKVTIMIDSGSGGCEIQHLQLPLVAREVKLSRRGMHNLAEQQLWFVSQSFKKNSRYVQLSVCNLVRKSSSSA